MRIWVADGVEGLMLKTGGECRRIGPPGGALCAVGDRVYCAGEKRCVCVGKNTCQTLFDFALPPGVCALAAAGGSLCALSADADSVTAFSPDTGEILFCAPAGSYPRSLRSDPRGRCLAAACGAAGEILVLDGELRCLARCRVPGVAVDVCFLPRGLAALCAVEDGELSASLLRISVRGVVETLCVWPGVPSALCPLPDGGCLAGSYGEILRLRPDGRLAGRLPCPCPIRIKGTPGGPLICDPWQGRVLRPDGQTAYRGPDPEDALAEGPL